MDFENKPQIGLGIYTASEIAQILRLPYQKIYLWMNKYWDDKLGKNYGEKYSWQMDGTRAVSFHTFVEFYVMMRFSEAGVKPKEVMKAHTELVEWYKTPFPFALKEVLDGIRSDGKRIFLNHKQGTIELNGMKQFSLEIIQMFFVKLDFGDNNLASRFYPLGKEKSIVVDPARKFGSPVFKDHNIYPETFYGMYKAGESIEFIAYIYEVPEQMVKDAIEYCTAA
ncbi:DUF433 domain-containing protein [Altibacter lentus]|uniref:DUF433 domain-containing protein n=1 Tax=Altibacter lentus TaxID=1223410 RepID=UPI0005522C6B|nr:DUF433 domain-containing protein [Altibacter lentus]